MKRKASPAGAGLAVIVTTILGWIGCDGLSRMADQTADLLQKSRLEQYAAQAASWAGGPTAPANSSVPGTAQQIPAGNVPYVQSGNAAIPATTASAARPVTVTYQPFITVGTFNIQVFGKKKVSDPNVLEYLVDIARKFDVLSIQEIRDADQVALPYFMNALNGEEGPYRYLVGPREGDSVSKEQIAVIYNSQRLVPLHNGFAAVDPNQRMSRNPYVTAFQCRPVDGQQPFSFTLVSVHTKPEAVDLELEALADILPMVRQTSTEDDVILMGDLNASPRKFGRLGQIPNLLAVIPSEVPTNTAKTACYDNIIFDRFATSEFQQQFGVFDIATHYGLSQDQAALISDHMPVWAVFSIYESNANASAQVLQPAR